jgi:hypothetical protein
METLKEIQINPEKSLICVKLQEIPSQIQRVFREILNISAFVVVFSSTNKN